MDRRTFVAAALLLPAAPALARSAETFSTGGMAIHGADPVAYFTEGRPVQGNDAFGVKWGGAMWFFASAENLARFESDPRAYAPQYGGYCAYAMAEGAVAPSVPEAWTVHEGKLYLNYSTGVRSLWRKDIPGFVARADAHWPEALG